MSTASIKKDISKKPEILKVIAENIPAILRECGRWLGWRWELNDARDKWTKPPIDILRDKNGSSTNRRTWCAFDVAIKAAEGGFVDGIGVALGDGFCGVDFDNCRSRKTGVIAPDVLAYIPRLNTYGEVSPSGEGIKLILRGTLPKGRRSNDRVEMYDSGRYFCVSGHKLEGCSAELVQDSGQLAAIHRELLEAPQKVERHKRESKLNDLELALAALEGISGTRADNYNDWLLVGMALHAADSGLLSAWEGWSQGSTKYSEGVCREKWDSFNGSAVGLGSLIYWAGEDTGWKVPMPKRKASRAAREAKQAEDKRPEVILTTAEHENIRDAIAALANDVDVFQRGGLLVDIAADALANRKNIRAPEAPRLLEIPEARLRTRLSASAQFISIRETDEGTEEVRQHPPSWLVKGVGAAGRWPGIRHLEAVVTTPILRRDGTILQAEGYDAESGILYLPRQKFPEISDVPLADEIGEAVDALLEAEVDFPFEKPEHKAAWLAGLFTLIARFAFDGPAPLFLCEANIRGAGKGLLVDAASLVATGDSLATASYSHDDAEMRKVITSIALAGDRAVLLDNIGGNFGVPALDAALTSTKWKDRLLGGNERVELPLLAVWFGTGNNPVLVGDVVRRVCPIRLNSPEETPEEREGFRHADLRAWLRKEHPRLLMAALTILRGYIVAGCPDQKLKPWGSFEGWSALVRSAVVWAKQPDPGATRQELSKQSDTEGSQLKALIAGWREVDYSGRGKTVAEIFEAMGTGSFPTMQGALLDSCTGRSGERPTARALGFRLRHFRGRVIGGFRFETVGESNGSSIWKVVGTGDTGDTGDV